MMNQVVAGQKLRESLLYTRNSLEKARLEKEQFKVDAALVRSDI